MKGPLPFHHGAGKDTKDFAKHLRQRETSAEDLFWQMVRDRKMLNLKIRRQHPPPRRKENTSLTFIVTN